VREKLKLQSYRGRNKSRWIIFFLSFVSSVSSVERQKVCQVIIRAPKKSPPKTPTSSANRGERKTFTLFHISPLGEPQNEKPDLNFTHIPDECVVRCESALHKRNPFGNSSDISRALRLRRSVLETAAAASCLRLR
jgi:hypothetical protein